MSGSHPHNFPKLHNAMWPGPLAGSILVAAGVIGPMRLAGMNGIRPRLQGGA